MNAIDFYYLLAIGVGLFIFEMFVPTFFFFWMGAGFIVVAVGSFLYPFESGLAQIALALSIGVVLVFLFRKKMVQLTQKEQTQEEEHAHIGGQAIIENGHIKFDGTYWNCDEDLSGYPHGTHVEVVIKENKAHIVKA